MDWSDGVEDTFNDPMNDNDDYLDEDNECYDFTW